MLVRPASRISAVLGRTDNRRACSRIRFGSVIGRPARTDMTSARHERAAARRTTSSAGVPGSEHLFAVCSLVVLVSIVMHGASPALMTYRATQEAVIDEERITVPQVKEKMDAQEPVHLLDVRSQKAYDGSPQIVAGGVRVRSDQIVAEVARLGIPRDAWIVLYCTCNAEQTSGTAARALRAAGWERAVALVGGWDAWVKAGMPVTAKVRAPELTPLTVAKRA